MKQKLKYRSICFLSLFLLISTRAFTAFAAGGALGADRNGTPYTYVIGYMYSGSSQTVNTREIFTSPNNYDVWLCPVCGRDPLGNSQGTALAADLYMPCYGYDIAAAGGEMSIRYALVRHRHNNGQLSDDRVYIPVNVPMYAGCYYGYDLTEPAGVQVSAPTGWQRDSAVVRFSGGTDNRHEPAGLERGAGRLRQRHPSLRVQHQRRGMDGLSRGRPHRDHHGRR